jgi:nicotinamidase/pyrazinamidase
MIDPRDVAFLDVDTQNDFMMPDGRLYVPGAEKLIPRMRRLVAYAAENGVPILATLDTHAPDDPEFARFPPHCVKGTDGHAKIAATRFPRSRVIENRPQEVALTPGEEIVLEKPVFTLFANVNAEAVVRAIGRRRYVVFGVATEYCVRADVLDLLKRDIQVTVVADAIAGITAAGEEKALAEMKAAGAVLATTDELVGPA